MIETNISVIIPVWNNVSYIACCLDSILKQSYKDIEVIIIDDASTDGTSKVLQHYAAEDNRIVLYTNPYNEGPGACRNIGINKACGDYILFVDSDDFLTEGILEVLAQHLRNDYDILMFNGSAFRDEDRSIINTRYIPLEGEYFEGGRIREKYLFNLYDSHTSCMKLYVAKFLNQNNICFPESIYGEDVEFWIRCLMVSRRISYLPYFGYMRRYRTNSIITSGSDKNIIDRINNIATLLELTKTDAHLYHYITASYLRGICQNAIAKDRKLYHRLFDTLIHLSERYNLDISQELVSVVIPVYNQGEKLMATLNSVLNQTHINIEVLVVDDGSEEDIECTVKTLHDDRIHYYRLPHRNANVSRNYGIQMAKGKYVAMLDADDLWEINHLADCIKTLKQTGADGLYGDLILRYTSGKEIKVTVGAPQENESMINYLLRVSYAAQTSTLFLTAESAKNIRWDETLNRHQDYDFVVRYSKKFRFAVKNNPTVIYRYSSENQNIDFRSCIRVIETWKKDIEPDIYYGYNRSMLQLAAKWEAEPEIIEHYRKEALCYIEYVSFKQFVFLIDFQDKIQAEKLKEKYIEYINHIEISYQD